MCGHVDNSGAIIPLELTIYEHWRVCEAFLAHPEYVILIGDSAHASKTVSTVECFAELVRIPISMGFICSVT